MVTIGAWCLVVTDDSVAVVTDDWVAVVNGACGGWMPSQWW